MKKFSAIFVASAMLVAMTGCGSKAEETPVAEVVEEAAETVEETAETVEEAAEEVVEEVAEEVTGEEATDPISYADFLAADVDTPVMVETYVQAKQSWWDNKATVYSQNEEGAYFLYNMQCSEDAYELLTPGTKIRVTGYKSEWSGEVEIVDATFTILEGDTYVATPEDITAVLGTDSLSDYMNKFVSVNGAVVEASGDGDAAFLYSWDGSGTQGDDLYFNVSVDGQTYTFTVESYLCDSSTDVYKTIEGIQIGDTLDLEGFLYWYEGPQPHITSAVVK